MVGSGGEGSKLYLSSNKEKTQSSNSFFSKITWRVAWKSLYWTQEPSKFSVLSLISAAFNSCTFYFVILKSMIIVSVWIFWNVLELSWAAGGSVNCEKKDIGKLVVFTNTEHIHILWPRNSTFQNDPQKYRYTFTRHVN